MIDEFYYLTDAELRTKIDTIFDDLLTTEERDIYDSTFITNTVIEKLSISNNAIEVRMLSDNYWVIISNKGIYLNKKLRFRFKDVDFLNYLETI